MIRLPVEVIVARRLQDAWTPGLIVALRSASVHVIGEVPSIEFILKAGTGCFTIGRSAPFSAAVAVAAARSAEALTIDPFLRFRRDMMFVVHISQSMARRSLEPLLVQTLQRGWNHVLAHQRFGLTAPARPCPAIEEAVAALPAEGLRASARLILAVAPAVGKIVPEKWKILLSRIASTRSATQSSST